MRVALCQCEIVWEQAEKSIELLERPVREFCRRFSPDIMVLPETFSVGFTMNPDVCEMEDGVSASWLRKTARETGVAFVGSIPTYGPDGKRYNRCYFVSPEGWERHYDKRHLFNYSGEGKTYTPGNEICKVQYKGWTVNLNVCYDLRFPVWSRNVDNGYDLLINIANWPDVRIEAAKALAKARAIENCCYCLFCNRVGSDAFCNYNGQSMIFDFFGQKIASRRKILGTQFLFADLDRDALDHYHEKFPAVRDSDSFTIEI